MEDERETSNLRHRRRRSAMSLSCCFHGSHDQYDFITPSSPFSESGKSSPCLRSPASWFRSSKVNTDQNLPEIKPRSRNFMSRLGRRHCRYSADFSYDPLSYALNFDDGNSSDDQFVNDRLPVSPPWVRAARLRLRDLELPSPPSMRKNGESPMKPKGGSTAAEPPFAVESGSGKVKSPTAAHGWKSDKSPTTAAEGHGIRKVQSPMMVPGKRSVDSPKAATGGRLGVEQTRAAPRQIFVEQ